MKTKLYKILSVMGLTFLLLGMVTYYSKILASEEQSSIECQHEIDENNMCTNCSTEMFFSHTIENEVNYYSSFEDVVEYSIYNGGKIKLLNDVDANRRSLEAVDLDITLDLNGYTLSDSYIYIGHSSYTGTISVIDSSFGKTGKFINSEGTGNILYGGKLIAEGVTFAYGITCEDGAIAEYNNVKFINYAYFRLNENSQIILNNVVAEDSLFLDFGKEFNHSIGKYQIIGGSFSKIMIDESKSEDFILNDLLKDGYAFSQNGEVINGYVGQLENVDVVAHEHEFDRFLDLGSTHIMSCRCGKANEDLVGESHTLGSDGYCEVCAYEISAIVSDGTNNSYFVDVESAMKYAVTLENSHVKVLKDGEIKSVNIVNNLTIDLNGYELYIEYVGIGETATLTINDSSEQQTGKIYYQKNYTTFNLAGKMIINSGTIESIIDLLGNEQQHAYLEVNGGTFTANVSFIVYDCFDLIIKGGIFDNNYLIEFQLENPQYNIELYGGIYVNGINNQFYGESVALSELLPTVDGCEVNFMDKYNNIIKFTNGETGYNYLLTLTHSAGVISKDDTHHEASCNVCNVTYFEGEHTLFEYVCDTEDVNLHNVLCGVCEYEISSQEHEGGSANCTEKALCTYCNSSYGKINSEVHVGGNATCTNKAVCELCDEEYGDINSDNHNSKEYKYIQSSDNKEEHDYIHSCCGEVVFSGLHHHGDTNCMEHAVCVECDLPYGEEPKGHQYDNDCDASCNVCGEGREIAPHKYDDACDSHCNECESKREVKHLYGTDGKCSICGDETTVVAEKKKNAGAIIYGVSGSVSALAVGIFILLKKKRLF